MIQLTRSVDGRSLTSAIEKQDHVNDVVPLTERRSATTLGLLWITMVTGFPTVLFGFQWFKAGLTLPQVMECIAISCALLLCYTVPSTLLGAKSGQTYSLLSRHIFGSWGSRMVSANLVWISVAWYGLNANFLADGLKGIYHWNIGTAWLGVGFAILMAFNNFFGFSGIANFARYIAGPMLIAWVGFTFVKATFTCSPAVLTAVPAHPFSYALTLVSAAVIGYSVWGNEADYWRYGKPTVLNSMTPLVAALLVGQVIFPVTGWMMAYMTGITEEGAATNLMNQYAFGGLSIIAAAVLAVSYFAVNDSGLYGAINGVSNLSKARRKNVVTGLAISGALAAIALTFVQNSLELVATISSICLPGATVVMLVEFFWFARKDQSEYTKVPSFADLPDFKWPAVISLLVGFTVGIATSGLIPALSFMHVGICSLQAWCATAVAYTVLRPLARTQIAVQRSLLEKLLQQDGLNASPLTID
jgi:purine-cytosine permease-like protein